MDYFLKKEAGTLEEIDLDRLGVHGFPSIILIDTNGKELMNFRDQIKKEILKI